MFVLNRMREHEGSSVTQILLSRGWCNRDDIDDCLADLAPSAPTKMIIPGYDVGDALGEGGMGVVYEASQTGVGRTVALKILAPHYASDTEFVQRFLREGRNASAINSPYVVQVYDAGRSGDILFIAQEYVRQ